MTDYRYLAGKSLDDVEDILDDEDNANLHRQKKVQKNQTNIKRYFKQEHTNENE
jgi:hypothetical protein